MGWYSFNNMKCKECGHEYKQDSGTLAMYDKGNYECPKCGSEVEIILMTEEQFENMRIKERELFKGRNKRSDIKITTYSCGFCEGNCNKCIGNK